ncbi:Uracil-DNA glycosylase [Rhizobium sp. RU20A]|uniref:uracil-DNA glycosylase family protein n=1 Tax=Rhizobium sp. RU20A TaxID=1907412 RepID=UPI0009570E9B|nr:uracil-DNA glycosylase family protein [Rhizobium sp. RU20A]SIQ14392.1 Uracil-DNA glycosylase [Rhizobium sp. RU20A]
MDEARGTGPADARLTALGRRIAACRLCVQAPLRGPEDRLPHEPRPVAVLSSQARILIAGQAPGIRVHDSGQPFNDPSGDRLRTWLSVDRDTFYDPDRFAIVPMGFCFPGYDRHGGDLPPRRECAPLWRSEVMAAMPQISLVLAIGHHAQRWHIGADCPDSMTETVRRFRQYLDRNSGPSVIPLPHPSWRNSGWLNRNPWFADEVLPELRQRVALLMV